MLKQLNFITVQGAYNEKTKKWYTVTKVGNGFDDAKLEELQKEIKNIIEPILFSWIKENMPDITKEVLTEVVKENNKNKIEAMLATWIQENMTNITKDILLEVVKKNKIDKRLVSEEFHESEQL